MVVMVLVKAVWLFWVAVMWVVVGVSGLVVALVCVLVGVVWVVVVMWVGVVYSRNWRKVAWMWVG
ncbi:hypothetical protein [Streptomyces spectabilis]|uniref:hypothetical protein n=1 Tax=Streptomyces spectabilis TaxID=68270 RepID=UPI001478D7F1|nr:hypothetical protein [Streptomyces spectabilis]